MSSTRASAVAGALAVSLLLLAGCAPSPEVILGAGQSGGHTTICIGDFSQPMTEGEPLELGHGTQEVTLIRADLVDAKGVRIIEQSAARAVLLADGTHLSVGTVPTTEGDESWDARVPLKGTVVRDDGGEMWSIALALERTADSAGGFTAVDLTYEVNGQRHVVRGTQSLTFPATGGHCK
jgi:hypothetical protein